jgi:hypothetical protein
MDIKQRKKQTQNKMCIVKQANFTIGKSYVSFSSMDDIRMQN